MSEFKTIEVMHDAHGTSIDSLLILDAVHAIDVVARGLRLVATGNSASVYDHPGDYISTEHMTTPPALHADVTLVVTDRKIYDRATDGLCLDNAEQRESYLPRVNNPALRWGIVRTSVQNPRHATFRIIASMLGVRHHILNQERCVNDQRPILTIEDAAAAIQMAPSTLTPAGLLRTLDHTEVHDNLCYACVSGLHTKLTT